MESVQTVNKETVNLKLGIISKSAVVKVTLIVNNEVVEVFENFSKTDTGYLFDAWLEKTVQLQTGSNDLHLIVQNEQGALKHQRKIEVEIIPSLRKDHAQVFKKPGSPDTVVGIFGMISTLSHSQSPNVIV